MFHNFFYMGELFPLLLMICHRLCNTETHVTSAYSTIFRTIWELLLSRCNLRQSVSHRGDDRMIDLLEGAQCLSPSTAREDSPIPTSPSRSPRTRLSARTYVSSTHFCPFVLLFLFNFLQKINACSGE